MAIVATGQKTIVDLSDGKSLSVYIGSNLPRTQIKDGNTNAFNPDWTEDNLVLTPHVYVNQKEIALTDSAITNVVWKRRAVGDGEAGVDLLATETVTNKILTVKANVLDAAAGNLLTYLVTATYLDPDTKVPVTATAEVSFAMVTTGQSAETATVTGEQVFKYNAEGTSSSVDSVTLTASLQNASVAGWQYKDGDKWVACGTDGTNSSATATSWVIAKDAACWLGGETATIRLHAKGNYSGNDLYDEISLYKVFDGTDGSAGKDSSVVFLTNENVTFAGDVDGKVGATTITTNVVAYTGTTKMTPKVGTISGAPTGMTVTAASTAVSNEIVVTVNIAEGSDLGDAGELSGEVLIPVTYPVSTTLKLSWSKVNTGATGSNAVVMNLYAPDGTVFLNHEGEKVVAVAAYDGSTPITAETSGTTFVWSKFEGTNWTTITGESGDEIAVAGTDVASTGSYRCVMTYKGVEYTDIITLQDKTDNYQATIYSSGGDIFKNTVGQSTLTCQLWQNGKEVDIEGTAFVYNWYRLDAIGNILDGDTPFATTKSIDIDGNDVDGKTTFVCRVSEKE